MALSLSASIKVGESPWRLSVEGGYFGKGYIFGHTELTPL